MLTLAYRFCLVLLLGLSSDLLPSRDAVDNRFQHTLDDLSGITLVVVVLIMFIFSNIHQQYSINETLETTASTKTTKMRPNKIPFSEDNLTLVKRPGAQGSAIALEHYPFQRKLIYIIGCHL